MGRKGRREGEGGSQNDLGPSFCPVFARFRPDRACVPKGEADPLKTLGQTVSMYLKQPKTREKGVNAAKTRCIRPVSMDNTKREILGSCGFRHIAGIVPKPCSYFRFRPSRLSVPKRADLGTKREMHLINCWLRAKAVSWAVSCLTGTSRA